MDQGGAAQGALRQLPVRVGRDKVAMWKRAVRRRGGPGWPVLWPVGLAVVAVAVVVASGYHTVHESRQTAVSEATGGRNEVAPDAWPALSRQVVSNALMRIIATTIKRDVPQVDEVYVQELQGGGLQITAIGSLRGASARADVAARAAERYFIACYARLVGLHVVFASIYLRHDGRYVYAAGLGSQVARRLAVPVMEQAGGSALVDKLVQIDRFGGQPQQQAFAQAGNSL
jgi:hypothetical protein